MPENHESIALQFIKKHEGLRLAPYLCPAGKLTIGYGRNIEEVGISQAEAEHLLTNDVKACVADLKTFPFWEQLNDPRKAAMIDLRFNIGPSRFRGFKNMIASLNAGDYWKASDEMKSSRWYSQVGSRAVYLVDVMKRGAL